MLHHSLRAERNIIASENFQHHRKILKHKECGVKLSHCIDSRGVLFFPLALFSFSLALLIQFRRSYVFGVCTHTQHHSAHKKCEHEEWDAMMMMMMANGSCCILGLASVILVFLIFHNSCELFCTARSREKLLTSTFASGAGKRAISAFLPTFK
jgi:hypothetical protein